MKIYAYYDQAGNIQSLVTVNAPEGTGAMLMQDPGLFVAEIEGLKLKSDKPSVEELREIAENYKVSIPIQRGTLIKKK